MAVVQTKLRVPVGQRALVHRPHLLARLDQGLGCKLILLSGPAGFGKTTLLAEWIRQRRLPAGWLSIDEGDNDLSRFFAHVVFAFQTLLAEPLDPVIERLQSVQTQSSEPVLSALINTIEAWMADAPEKILLFVLDDYHLIEAQPVHEAVAYLLDHLPVGLHLVISSRADPPLSLPRLRAQAQLSELRAADLRFSEQEAADFLNRVMDLNLEVDAVQALAERTEGWIAGLQMAAISLQGREDRAGFIQSFTGSNRFILDYLLEEVLQRQPEAIQSFLIHTSILSRCCGPLCDCLLEDLKTELAQQSQSILEYLDRANLFVVPQDDQREWYRYHRLFADLLQKRLNHLFPERVPGLHRRASEWFETRGDLEEAIEHALLANDADRAAGLVEQAAESMMMLSQFMTLRRWLSRLPEGQIAVRPTLCIFYAWTLFLNSQSLEEVEKYLALIPDEDELASIRAAPLRAYISAFSGLMPTARGFALQALEKLPEEDHFLRSMAYIVLAAYEFSEGSLEAGYWAFEQAAQISDRTGNILASVMVLSGLAENYRKLGQLRKVDMLFRKALSQSVDSKGSKLPIAGRALIGLGDLMREWNRLDAAEEYLNEGIELIEKWGALAAYSGYIALARLQHAQGNVPAALETLEKAEQLAARTKTTPIDDWAVALVRASLWLEMGAVEPVEGWVEQRRLLQEIDTSRLSEGERFAQAHMRKYEWAVLARLYLHQGRPEEALGLLDRILPEVEKIQRVGLLIEIQILKALAFQQKGMAEAAFHSLEAALALAEPEGYVRTFISMGEPLRRLLSSAQRRGVYPQYVSALLTAFEQEKRLQAGRERASHLRSAPQKLDGVESLSEREMEVLHFLRSSLTVPEIAGLLCVADSTVRSHIKSIYAKLDVHRRMDAVQRAQALGLLKAGLDDPVEKPAENR